MMHCTLRAARTAAAAARRTYIDGAREYVLVEKRGGVGLVTLHRPKALNALSTGLMAEVNEVTQAMDADPEIGCVVLTGRGAGAA